MSGMVLSYTSVLIKFSLKTTYELVVIAGHCTFPESGFMVKSKQAAFEAFFGSPDGRYPKQASKL